MLRGSASLLAVLLAANVTWALAATASQQVTIGWDPSAHRFAVVSPSMKEVDAFDFYTASIEVVLAGLPKGSDVNAYILGDGKRKILRALSVSTGGSQPGDITFSVRPYARSQIDTLQLMLQVAGGGSTTIDLGRDSWRTGRTYSLRLRFENDSRFSDHNYTNGLRVEWGVNDRMLPRCLVWADRFFFQGADRNWGLALTQNIYTPDSLEAVSIQQYDRPYAGWLYGGFFLNSVNRACDKQMVVELDVGLLGNGLAGEVQSWWHGRCFIDAPVPKGWHNHVAGDLGLQLSLFGQTKLWGNRRDDPWADLWGFGKSEVGNVYFRPTLGGALRVGDFRRPPPTGPVPTRRNRATETGDSGERYVFFRADCKYVFHNGTMQGGKLFSRNAEPNHTVPVNRLVNTFEGGFHYSYGSYFVEWSLVQISPEIDLPGAPGAHKYWQIQVGDSDQHMCRKGYREIIAAFVAYLVLDQLDD